MDTHRTHERKYEWSDDESSWLKELPANEVYQPTLRPTNPEQGEPGVSTTVRRRLTLCSDTLMTRRVMVTVLDVEMTVGESSGSSPASWLGSCGKSAFRRVDLPRLPSPENPPARGFLIDGSPDWIEILGHRDRFGRFLLGLRAV